MKKRNKKRKVTNRDIILSGLGLGARLVAIENSNGYVGKTKVHKSKKQYSRKQKNEKNVNFNIE